MLRPCAPKFRLESLIGASFLAAFCLTSFAQESSPATAEVEVLAGHSMHGEVFNEGPRQAAYLMNSLAEISFPASTENAQAQAFINQGVSQLHGFWYYEAERSFRQAAVIDPDCAMSYWGMAMANSGNLERARGFLEEANARLEGVTDKERKFIEAYTRFCREETKDGKEISRKDRAQRFTRDLETIVEEYPDDIEAKAFLALQLWQNQRAGLPIVSHVAINAVLQDVFDVNPMHPAHHYRIHLWDGHKPDRALASAALCGPSSPGIAHMWHMPGHIYDKLHRYNDAAWQQEASARVDHAHMMRDRVMPDQIHNFAHNNEWLVRSLVKVGRVDDALSLARNMLELPRHPKYNAVKEGRKGSAKYGRERLLLVLSSYRLWPELIAFSDTMYLEGTDERELQNERLKYLGIAYAAEGQTDQATATMDELTARVDALRNELIEVTSTLESLQKEKESLNPKDENKSEPSADADAVATADESSPQDVESKEEALAAVEDQLKDKEGRKKAIEKEVKQIEKGLASIRVMSLAAEAKWADAVAGWKDADLNDNLLKAEWMFAAGQTDEAMKLLDKEIKGKPGQLLPAAVKAHVQMQSGDAEAAGETFAKVRELAAHADLNTPLLARLTPIAESLQLGTNWGIEPELNADLGDRPDLATLGPFRWRPYGAPDFAVQAPGGEMVHRKQLAGQPTLVIFYLGFGCLHCVEQLHAFSPRLDDFTEAGINVIAISTEDLDSLKKGLTAYEEPLLIPLHADPELTAFKAYRCFDDFESQPLHGTFLIDTDGSVLWQDISYEPFMDVDFALSESVRLLNLAKLVRQGRTLVNEDRN